MRAAMLLMILVIAGMSALANELPPRQEGNTGIAARHPMDLGIEQAYSGRASCKLVVPPGKTYGSSIGSGKIKPGWKTMHMRFYVWFSPNYRGGKLATTTALDSKTWVPGQAGKRPTGTDKANAMVCVQSGGGLTMYYYNLDQRGRWGSGGKPNIGRAPKLANGEWHCIEIQGTMNDPGEKNSLQRLWVDGELKGEWTGFRWRSAESLKWNSWCFLIGSNNKAAEEQCVLVDNIIIADRYIGPMVREARRPDEKETNSPSPRRMPAMSEAEQKKLAAEKEAGRLFQMARQAESLGQRDVAKRLYGQIVERFPGTEAAKKAKAKL